MMKKFFYMIVLLVACASCEYNEFEEPEEVDSTVIMFYPWSTNLKPYFDQNISDFATAIATEGLHNERVIVCIETTPNQASIIELKETNGALQRDTLSTFINTRFTTTDGISQMLQRIKNISSTEHYSMIVGCHGMGWLPVASTSQSARYKQKLHVDVDGEPVTRYFGGLSSQYQINISTFADAVKNVGIKLEYLLFDDCYMSSVEAAYQLKDITNYVIACPTEVMSYGYPYHKIGKYLLGTPDYDGVCNGFYDFYLSYKDPYGTIAVTDCNELDNLAVVVKKINLNASKENVDISAIQRMDGYTPTIFYDLEDVVRNKCTDSALFEEFQTQLNKTIISKRHTTRYYAAVINNTLPISTYCGITTSDCSISERADAWTSTSWYQATH
jgi:hypothetical protein